MGIIGYSGLGDVIMNINEQQEWIIEIEREISALPAGSITTKKVKKWALLLSSLNSYTHETLPAKMVERVVFILVCLL